MTEPGTQPWLHRAVLTHYNDVLLSRQVISRREHRLLAQMIRKKYPEQPRPS